jgi:hypothetical protein
MFDKGTSPLSKSAGTARAIVSRRQRTTCGAFSVANKTRSAEGDGDDKATKKAFPLFCSWPQIKLAIRQQFEEIRDAKDLPSPFYIIGH